MDKLFDIYKRNFPNNIRNEERVREILNNSGNHVIWNGESGVSVINKSTVIMLCVDEECRNKGTGSALLKESEDYIRSGGYKSVNIGAGFDYLLPGVPESEENLRFFTKRGYTHSWGDDECFDMDMLLEDFAHSEYSIGDEINGVKYRWAKARDIDDIADCAVSACIYQDEKFDKYYKNAALYDGSGSQRVLAAVKDEKIIGAVIVSVETEGKGIGSVGCTVVRHDYTHNKTGTSLIMLATAYLKDAGLKLGHLGYTYSGLEKMYGRSGYKITVKYMMAQKAI